MSLLRYGNKYYQSVAYASRLSIMLGRTQNVKELYNIYNIRLDYVVIEIFIIFVEIPWWGGPLAHMGH